MRVSEPMRKMFTPSVKGVVVPSDRATARHDVLTVGATAVLVYALASVLHEIIGHGGACMATGGQTLEFSSMHFDCAHSSDTEGRIVAAGGTIATLVGGIIALALYQLKRGAAGWRYALWLFAAVNLMQGTGYFMFSGVTNAGDLATVIDGARLHWLWRLMFLAGGTYLYYRVTLLSFELLDPFIGEARPRRFEHAVRLGVRPYVVGALVAILAGLLNPRGIELVLVSGVASTLGGTSGLAWGPQLLRGTRTPSAMLEKPVVLVQRNWFTIVAGTIVGIAFIVGLGPGFSF
jgi:hypothetical protein